MQAHGDYAAHAQQFDAHAVHKSVWPNQDALHPSFDSPQLSTPLRSESPMPFSLDSLMGLSPERPRRPYMRGGLGSSQSHDELLNSPAPSAGVADQPFSSPAAGPVFCGALLNSPIPSAGVAGQTSSSPGALFFDGLLRSPVPSAMGSHASDGQFFHPAAASSMDASGHQLGYFSSTYKRLLSPDLSEVGSMTAPISPIPVSHTVDSKYSSHPSSGDGDDSSGDDDDGAQESSDDDDDDDGAKQSNAQESSDDEQSHEQESSDDDDEMDVVSGNGKIQERTRAPSPMVESVRVDDAEHPCHALPCAVYTAQPQHWSADQLPVLPQKIRMFAIPLRGDGTQNRVRRYVMAADLVAMTVLKKNGFLGALFHRPNVSSKIRSFASPAEKILLPATTNPSSSPPDSAKALGLSASGVERFLRSERGLTKSPAAIAYASWIRESLLVQLRNTAPVSTRSVSATVMTRPVMATVVQDPVVIAAQIANPITTTAVRSLSMPVFGSSFTPGALTFPAAFAHLPYAREHWDRFGSLTHYVDLWLQASQFKLP